MKNLTLFAALLITSLSYGQKNNGEIVIFSSLSEPVHVILNGILQNYQPESNLRIQGLENNFYNARIEGPNNSFVIEKNLIVKQDTLITYRVVEKKGKYKLRFFTETPLQSAQEDQNQTVIHYHITEAKPEIVTETTTVTTTTTAESTEPEMVEDENVNVNINMNSSSSGTEMSNSTTINEGESSSESVEMNVSVSETGMSTSINVNDQGNQESINSDVNINSSSTNSTTYTETTTITSTSSVSSSETVNGMNNQTYSGGNVMIDKADASSGSSQHNESTMGHLTPVDATGIAHAKEAIESEAFAEDKMRVAKQFSKDRALTVSQIEELAVLFSFSEDRLTYVKYAYHNCLNKNDYYQLMDVFDFSDDKEALENYINEQ